jgi:hypothetical protein
VATVVTILDPLTRRVDLRRRAPRADPPAGYHNAVIVDHLDLSAEEFALATGWEIKPEGACKADVCVPLGGLEGFDTLVVAGRLGMAVVDDQEAGLWAFGPESIGNRALVSAVAPDLILPDLEGNEFRLSTLRGQKVVLVAWAPY